MSRFICFLSSSRSDAAGSIHKEVLAQGVAFTSYGRPTQRYVCRARQPDSPGDSRSPRPWGGDGQRTRGPAADHDAGGLAAPFGPREERADRPRPNGATSAVTPPRRTASGCRLVAGAISL